MKNRIISFALCLLMILGAMPVCSLANEDHSSMPFNDVCKDAWYYDYVISAYQNGWMAGTSASTFSPNTPLTRAMFVTILAAFSGEDLSVYTEKPDFVDTEEGKWYTKSICWAVENKIASGYGNGKFGVNDKISREQLCVMLYKYAFYKEYDITDVLDSALNKFYDSEKAHTWASSAIKWASTYSLISGTGNLSTGEPILSPGATATRAQAAVILSVFENTNFSQLSTPIVGLTLNGNSIDEYKIVYGITYTKENSSNYNEGKEIASELQKKLKKATGITLEVYKDTECEVGEYEILIGKTNREELGVITVDRSDFEEETAYVKMDGNYLVFASNEIYKSTYYAIYLFLEDALGYYDMANGCSFINPSLNLNIEGDYELIDSPDCELRVNIQRDGGNEELLTSDNVVHEFMTGVHSFAEFAREDYEPTWSFHCEYYLNGDPCLSDSDTIDLMIKNVKTILNKYPDRDRLWFTQSDGVSYCTCDDCKMIYRTYGRCATYIQILQYVGNAIKDDYPNVKLVALAYKYTHLNKYNINLSNEDYADFLSKYTNERYVPSQSLKCPENVIIMYCTDKCCFSHEIGNTECDNPSCTAVKAAEEIALWQQICDHLYIWDYTNGAAYKHQVFPILNLLYDNYHYFSEIGVEGVYVLGDSDDYGDFGELKSYLVGKLAWNMNMTREEYDNYVNMFLKGYYGEGWRYIRTYLEKTEQLSSANEWNIWGKETWNDVITREQYIENIDYLDSLFQKALSLCDTQDQTLHINKVYVQVKYIRLNLAYQDYLDSENEADLEKFKELNYAYHDFLLSVGYKVSNNWTVELNPEKWSYWND